MSDQEFEDFLRVLGAVAKYKNQSADVSVVALELGFSDTRVVDLVRNFPPFITVKQGAVQRLSLDCFPRICFRYGTRQCDCPQKDECSYGNKRLHVCLAFLVGNCQATSCPLNHFLRARDPQNSFYLPGVDRNSEMAHHNESVIRTLKMTAYSAERLGKVFLAMERSIGIPSDVCQDYTQNSGACGDRKQCRDGIHLCKDLVFGMCSGRSCGLAHDICDNLPGMYGRAGSRYGQYFFKLQLPERIRFRKALLNNMPSLLDVLLQGNQAQSQAGPSTWTAPINALPQVNQARSQAGSSTSTASRNTANVPVLVSAASSVWFRPFPMASTTTSVPVVSNFSTFIARNLQQLTSSSTTSTGASTNGGAQGTASAVQSQVKSSHQPVTTNGASALFSPGNRVQLRDKGVASLAGRRSTFNENEAVARPRDLILVPQTSGVTVDPNTALASIIQWELLDGSDWVDVFSGWNLTLERAFSVRMNLNNGPSPLILDQVGVMDLIRYSFEHEDSRLPSALQTSEGAIVSDDFKSISVPGSGSAESDITFSIRRTLYGVNFPPETTALNRAFAWYLVYPDGTPDKLMGEDLLNMTVGLTPSYVLENIFVERPDSIVVLNSFGLEKCLVDLGAMQLTDSAGAQFDLKREEVETTAKMPVGWIPMIENAHRTFMIVPLTIDQDEYKTIHALIPNRFISPQLRRDCGCKALRIFRIQNQFLKEQIDNRFGVLRKKYSRYSDVQLRKMTLFHGTRPDILHSICENNFDWRRAGDAVGVRFGCGAYFGADFGVSDGYSTPVDMNPANRVFVKYLFAVSVIVGTTFVGSQGLRYPPDWRDGIQFDTAVDNLHRPSMYVKFYESEYAPSYLIEYQLTPI